MAHEFVWDHQFRSGNETIVINFLIYYETSGFVLSELPNLNSVFSYKTMLKCMYLTQHVTHISCNLPPFLTLNSVRDLLGYF